MSRLLLVVALIAVVFADVTAQAPDAARIRAAFLQMIARPRVPLAPETQPRIDAGAYRASSSASRLRPNGARLFLKSTSATVAGRP